MPVRGGRRVKVPRNVWLLVLGLRVAAAGGASKVAAAAYVAPTPAPASSNDRRSTAGWLCSHMPGANPTTARFSRGHVLPVRSGPRRWPHLLRPHLRGPDERPRLRAAQRPARGGGVRRGAQGRGRGRGRAEHLRGAGERRRRPLRQPRTPRACEGEAAGDADCCRQLPRPEGPRHDHEQGAVGRRGLRHPQPWLAVPVLLERARVAQEAQVEILESLDVFPSTLPTRRESAYAAWVSVSVGCNNTCTFCIVPGAARQGEGPPPRRHPRRGARAGGRRRQRGHPAGAERQRVRRGVRRPAGVEQVAACLRGDRRPRAGPVHLATPGRVHRRRHRGHGRDAERDAVAARAAAVGI